MAAYLTERPTGTYHWSKNPIRYVLAVTNPNRTDNVVQVRVIYHQVSESNSGSLVTTMDLTPDEEGNVYAYINEFLDDLLAPVFPDGENANITPAAAQHITFWIEYRNLNATILALDSDPEWTSDSEYKRIAVLGGLQNDKYDSNSLQLFYEQFGGRLLTYMDPAGKKVHFGTRGWLTYLHTTDLDGNFKAILKRVYTDGREIEDDIPMTDPTTAAQCKLWHIPAMPVSLALDDDPTLWYYTIRIVMDAEDAALLVDEYKFYVDHRPFYDTSELVWINSLGGLETTRLLGDEEHLVEREYMEVGRTNWQRPWQRTQLEGEINHRNRRRQDLYRTSTGMVDSRAAQEALIDLMHSEAIYTWQAGRWVRVVVTTKNISLRRSTDGAWSVPIDWQIAYSHSQYTPRDFSPGLPSDPSIDLEVLLLQPPVLEYHELLDPGEEPNTRIVRFVWVLPIVGDPDFVRVRVRKLYTTEWTYSDDFPVTSGPTLLMTLDEGFTYEYALQSRNNEDDESVWALAPDRIIL